MNEQQSQQPSSELIAGAVLEPEGIRLFVPLVDVDALALQGCAAEDPSDWNDCALLWPRYGFHPDNTEFADALPTREVDLDGAIAILSGADAWFALDLVQKRLFTGGDFPHLRLRGMPAADEYLHAERMVLPPWWELHQHVNPAELRSQRKTHIVIPNPHRDVLWGSAMTRFFAEAMIGAIRDGKPWIGEDWEGKPCGDHNLTVEIHRDWLMTPRADLGGSVPRDCLHGGKDWIDDLADGQRFRVHQGADPMPIPTELSTYQNAPMGRHEMILYFDACRETMAAGWLWLIEDQRRIDDPRAAQRLGNAMDEWFAAWLTSPFEGGPTPAEIIRCDRVRIPLVDNPGSHVVDCDCPICEMMADGLLGPAFLSFDGHHLELDDEFAFSMCESGGQWEKQQQEWEEMNARIKADMKREEEEKRSRDGELETVWKNTWPTDGGIPGDKHGHLGLAFLVADMVSSLKDAKAPQHDVDQLNAAFRAYRSAVLPDQTAIAASSFKQTLETLAGKHNYLISRSADLQSRIDELARVPATDSFDEDVPF